MIRFLDGAARLPFMHMRGTPADMRQHAAYASLTGEIIAELMPQLQAVFRPDFPASACGSIPESDFPDGNAVRGIIVGIGVLRRSAFVLVGPSGSRSSGRSPDEPNRKVVYSGLLRRLRPR